MSIYEVKLNFNNYEEIIRVRPHLQKQSIHLKEIAGPVFYSIMDMLSLDYDGVYTKIRKLKANSDFDASQFSRSESLLVSDDLMLKRILDGRKGLSEVNDIIIMQSYVEAILMGNHNLYNPDIFKAYSNTFFKKKVMDSYYSEKGISSFPKFDPKNMQYNVRLVNDFHRVLKYDENYIELEFGSCIDLCVSMLYLLFKKGFTIKRCSNCGMLFTPFRRSDEIYCDRLSPQDHTRTCKTYGTEKLWYKKVKNNPTAKLYRNTYQAKQMLVRRNSQNEEYLKDFKEFKEESKVWKKEIKDGRKTEQEFEKWLHFVKPRRARNE